MSNIILQQLKDLGLNCNVSPWQYGNNTSLEFQSLPLRKALSDSLQSNLGPILLRCPTDASMYSRYHNGNISTQRRDENGKYTSSNGFEEVQLGTVIDSLMGKVTEIYALAIKNQMHTFYSMAFDAVVQIQCQFQALIQQNLLWDSYSQKMDELHSINNEINNILDDLPEILSSPTASTNYHSWLLNQRTKVNEILYFLKRKMDSKSQEIRTTQILIDPNELFYFFFTTKMALQSYVICMFLDLVLSHRTDEKSRQKIREIIESKIRDIGVSSQTLKEALTFRHLCNNTWNCWTPYEQWAQQQNENKAIIWFFENSKNETPIEIQQIDEAFNAGETALQNATFKLLPQ